MTSVDARGNATNFVYDDAGRRIQVINALNETTTFGYDANGNQKTVQDPKGNLTTIVYDELNRHVKTILPDSFEKSVSYDLAGRKIAERNQAGHEVHFAYDELARLDSITDPLGHVTSYTYDEVGNRIGEKDAQGRVTRSEFDALGREVARILPDSATERYTYDLAGDQKSRTDFKGATTLYDYDSMHRYTRRTYPGGSSVIFTYTNSGKRKTAVDDRGTTRYEYDVRERLSAILLPDGNRLDYSYDFAGRRESISVSSGGTTLTSRYTYDVLGRLSTIQDPQGGLAAYTYDANGNRQSLQMPNGMTAAYDYDSLNRLAAIETFDPQGTPVTKFAYAEGPTGNRTRLTELDGTVHNYDYDALNRLTGETVTRNSVPRWSNSFQYDFVGNRLRQERVEEGASTSAIDSVYDSRDRQQSAGAIHFTWDPNGNLVGKSGSESASYEWDFENRLKRATGPNGATVSFKYDVDGNRVESEIRRNSSSSPETIRYVVDPSSSLSQVILETNLSDGRVTYFTPGNELEPIGLLDPSAPGARKYLHTDGRGSVVALSDSAGHVSDSWQFEAFGRIVANTGTTDFAARFAGGVDDSTVGWYYNRNRWLDGRTGRFSSTDPFPSLPSDSRTLNRYAYALNDPVGMFDPTGLFGSAAEAMHAMGISAVLTTTAMASLAGLNVGMGLHYLDKDFYRKEIEAVSLGISYGYPPGRMFRNLKTPIGIGVGLGLAGISVNAALEVLIPLKNPSELWLFAAPGASASAANYRRGHSYSVYAGAVWNVPDPGSYAGPTHCFSGDFVNLGSASLPSSICTGHPSSGKPGSVSATLGFPSKYNKLATSFSWTFALAVVNIGEPLFAGAPTNWEGMSHWLETNLDF